MAKLDVQDMQGKKVETIEVSDALVAVPAKKSVIHQVVMWQQDNHRQYGAAAKTRGEVSGGGRKPWRQKGTGRARAGSTRSPIWRSGGVTHGPRGAEARRQSVPRRVRNLALRMALSNRVESGAIRVIKDLSFDTPKTKDGLAMLAALDVTKPLIVLGQANVNVIKSFRNLTDAKVISQEGLNVRDILLHKTCVVTVDALRQLEERLVQGEAA